MSHRKDPFTTFQHPGGSYNIDLPQSCVVSNTNCEGRQFTHFETPSHDLVVRVGVTAYHGEDDDVLVKQLREFTLSTCHGEQNFLLNPAERIDHRLLMSYSFDREGTNFLGNAYCWHTDEYIVFFAAAEPNFDYGDLESVIDKIMASIQVNPTVALP
jgi:hypothetical protein